MQRQACGEYYLRNQRSLTRKLYNSLINLKFYSKNKPLFFHIQMFEFGDTAFIVLRKQPLIFLHW